jgi:flavodoxin
MKIGIILFSETGNTYSVAKKLKEHLKHKDVTIEKIEIKRLSNDRSHFNFLHEPCVKDYDLIIFGAFTEGFMLTPVMKEYLSNQELTNKKVMAFITHFFPYAWMGGNHSLKQMVNLLEEKGSKILSTGIINWKSSKRSKDIDDLVNNFTQLI